MIVWKKAISWTLLRRIGECPRQGQFHVQRVPQDTTWPSYYADAGTIVQKFFEVLFNAGRNLDPEFAQEDRILLAVSRLWEHPWCRDLVGATTYPDRRHPRLPQGLGPEDLRVRVTESILKGMTAVHGAGLRRCRAWSEVQLRAPFRGLVLFGEADFIADGDVGSGDRIFDGKINTKKDADPDQVRYYALIRQMQGHRVSGGGFLYWRHGHFEDVDLSPRAMEEFQRSRWAPVEPILRSLREGVARLPAAPGPACYRCPWNQVCEDSATRAPSREDPEVQEVDFEDA